MRRMCSGLLCHLLVMAGIALMTAPVDAQTFSFELGGVVEWQFRIPEDVAVDTTTGQICVADTFNHRVQVFYSQGNFIPKFTSFDTDRGVFLPRGVAVDASSGNIVVADTANDGIRVFVP